MRAETFLKIFGEIDEKYIEQADDDDDENYLEDLEDADEGIVVRAGDPRKIFRRTFIASVACAAAVAVGAVFLMRFVLKSGFKIEPASLESSSVQEGESNEVSPPSDASSGVSAPSDASSIPDPPSDEITFLIGPDGKAILKSEITSISYTDKTVDTLTEDDIGAEIYCEGFAYYKEPCGIGYDSLKYPELFKGGEFLGETPVNRNEWKRVYVGDEIFGLKVKSANAFFHIDDQYDFEFPERYFFDQGYSIELEGTVEVEGFLQVNNHYVPSRESDEMIYFYPTTADLPLVPTLALVDRENGFGTRFDCYTLFNDSEFCYAGEFSPISLGYYKYAEYGLDGMGVGDVAYARVTLGNIRYLGGGIEATLERVELLSDILEHIDDFTDPIYPIDYNYSL